MISRHMIRTIAILACLIPVAANAQESQDGHTGGHAGHRAMTQHQMHHQPPGQPHDRTQQSVTAHEQPAGGPAPTQPGQAAFAAVQEIVEILEADPKTDWTKVNIDALREHLVDMNAVTLAADVRSEPVEGGLKFYVTGTGPVRNSIRRMVTAHAATMNGAGNWRFAAADTVDGATLTVTAPAGDAQKLRGLGFFGIMTRGMHHQEHHLMIARGNNPHHH